MKGLIDFAGMKCEEASTLSRETFIPCGAPVDAVVYHSRDKRAYMMCFGCADHNVRNRGGVIIASGNYTQFTWLFEINVKRRKLQPQ